MIATSGLHDSFSRIKKLAFAIRHARWNVGNFKRCIEYESTANVRDIVDVTCRLSQLFLRLQRGQVSSTFCIRRRHENSGGAF